MENAIKKQKTTFIKDMGPYQEFEVEFDTFIHNGKLLDTNVNLKIPTFCITYKDRQKLMNELAAVFEKYMI